MSPERVLAEIDDIVKRYQIRDIEIIDDCFNFDRKRATEIFNLIIARGYGLKISFPNGLRGDIIPDEMFPIMRDAGVKYIAWAVETASDRLQKLIKKGVKLDRLRRAIKLGAAHGIWGHGFFMFGFPSETLGEMEATVQFAVESQLHTASFFVVNPFQGTELFEMCKGKLGQFGDSKYFDFNSIPVNLSEVSDTMLHSVHKGAARRFYMRPARIARIVVGHPSKLDLVRYFLMLLHRVR